MSLGCLDLGRNESWRSRGSVLRGTSHFAPHDVIQQMLSPSPARKELIAEIYAVEDK